MCSMQIGLLKGLLTFSFSFIALIEGTWCPIRVILQSRGRRKSMRGFGIWDGRCFRKGFDWCPTERESFGEFCANFLLILYFKKIRRQEGS